MLTLFCLGNPTIKHKNNRHNAGLLLGEFLVDKLELKLKKFKNFKLTNTFQLDGHQCQIALSCLLYTSPSPRDRTRSRMPSSA